MSRMAGMSRFTGNEAGRGRPWYRNPEAPFLIPWGMFLLGLTLILARGLWEPRRTEAEHAFDRWADEQMRPAVWRKCHDGQPLPDGMVRCEAQFGVGRALVYCPGERSTEQTCRWL